MSAALPDSTEITMRDWDSLKSGMSARAASGEISTEAPSILSPEMHDSASATASPPSAQSWALLTRPERMSERTASWTASSLS